MSQPPIYILAVDDEPDLCALTKDFLEMSKDMEVDTVCSVQEAMTALAEKFYDVIVSDYQMPGEDGIQFLKSLRGAGDQIPFILLTGKGREEVVIEALNNGADSYLQKGGKSVPMYTELEHRIRATVQRHRTENALRESEGKFRGFYDSIRDGIVRVAMDGTILECNQAYLELTGYTLEELKQLTYIDLTPEKWHDMEREIISNIPMKIGHSEGYEKEYRRKDGLIFPISLRIWLIRDELGNPSHMWGIVRDITEIKQAEGALRQKTALLEAQVAASIDGILVIDENQKRVLVNQRIIELFNVPNQIMQDEDDTLLLKHVVSLTRNPEQFLEKVEHLYDKINETSRDEIEFKNGMVLDRYSAPVFDNNGKYYGRTWTFREITERKRMENEIRSSKSMLSKILATSPNFIYIYDLKEHRNLYTNREVVDFLGYTSQQIASMGSNLFGLILHPDDLKAVEEYQERQRHLADGVIIEAEYRMRRADGNWCWLRSRDLVFERDPDGSVRSAMGVAEDVTERKRAEKEIESSRRLHSKIMEASLNLVFIYDLKEHRNLYASRKMAEFLGYNPKQIQDMGSRLFEKILHPEDLKIVEEYQEMLRNLDDGKIAEVHYRLRKGDGNWCWIRSRNMVFERDPDGSVRSELGVAEDVSEKKLAEGELKVADLEIRKSKDMFRALIDHSYDAVFIHDMEGNVLDVNSTMLKLYKVTKEEALGYNIADFTGPDCSMHEAQEHWNQALAGVDQFFPWQARRPNDGSVFDVEVYLALIKFDEKDLILGNIRDITERKRSEEILLEAQGQLRMAMNLARLVHWEYDIVADMFTFDDQFYSLFGTTAEKEGGTKMSSSAYAERFIPPDEAYLVGTEVEAAQSTRDPNFSRQFEHDILRRDGERRTIAVVIRVVMDKTGRPVKTYGANQDITERKRSEKALLEANRKLNLLSNITRHDINNQLMTLIGNMTLLDRESLDDYSAQHLIKAEIAAERISSMIQITKEYEDIGVQAPMWQNIHDLLIKAADEVTFGPVKLVNDVQTDIEIFADPLIQKVFFNLMDNAVRHGQKISTIRFSIKKGNGSNALVCEDDGDGVSIPEKERIFERGYGQNTGLGLFLSREILSITGITIIEEGKPGHGARFVMTIPVNGSRESRMSNS